MAVRQHGFTRVSALGPIASLLEGHRGAISRVFSDVDLPQSLLDFPDLPIPLKEQFRLLERAARETGEAHFGAQLGQYIRADKLSAFGQWVCEADCLESAIDRATKGLNLYLQTGTTLRFQKGEDVSLWSIEFLDPESQGRYQNELLGVSYLIDTVRCFAGDDWSPRYVSTTCPDLHQAGQLEALFGTNVLVGRRVCKIEIPNKLLARPPQRLSKMDASRFVPTVDELSVPAELVDREAVIALTRLALLKEYPRVEWVANKMGLTRRTLQRRLKDFDTSFSEIVDQVILSRAKELVSDATLPITEIALTLGYTDPAHFSRAFKRWTGMAPSAFRRDVSLS